MADEVEARAREIAASAKHVRNPLPRGVWVLALVVGVAGVIFAAVIVASSTTESSTKPTPTPAARTGGFGMGIGIGLGAGLLIGYTLARRKPRSS